MINASILKIYLTLFLQAIREALDVIDADPTINLADFNTDYDSGDRFIDSITIFHSGYGAEWGVSSLLQLLCHAFLTIFVSEISDRCHWHPPFF